MTITPTIAGGVVTVPEYPGIAFHVVRAHHLDPARQIAHVELSWTDGPLAWLKVTGFAVWERRTPNSRRNVTFPARVYNVAGERRSFALLRVDDHNFHQAPTEPHERLRAAVLAVAEAVLEEPTRA